MGLPRGLARIVPGRRTFREIGPQEHRLEGRTVSGILKGGWQPGWGWSGRLLPRSPSKEEASSGMCAPWQLAVQKMLADLERRESCRGE